MPKHAIKNKKYAGMMTVYPNKCVQYAKYYAIVCKKT